MDLLKMIREEMKDLPQGEFCPSYFRCKGYKSAPDDGSPTAVRAQGIVALFCEPVPFIYKSDLIVGSIRPMFVSLTESDRSEIEKLLAALPERNFRTNFDHYAPDYETVLKTGIGGLLGKIAESEARHGESSESLDMLRGMKTALFALQRRIEKHVERAGELKGAAGYDDGRLDFIIKNCESIVSNPPKSFSEALQLVWMIHTSFSYEGRFAMALGRMDRYLYPFYERDKKAGEITKESAKRLIENTLVKICERGAYRKVDDVVNICIGGVDENGVCSVNELSYIILDAVKSIKLPGPNLSARITEDTPDEFLDECLKSIGTGLGYPALMNDSVNMAALRRYGYGEEDIRNYSMVGCIENFITGMQPPWSDGRFDAPRYLEYLLLDGEGYDESQRGIHTAPLAEITSMERFMEELGKQLSAGVLSYVNAFHKTNAVSEPEKFTSPFLSCFCRDCIERGRDINMGGSKYPSVHGVGLMGVGTVSDSLAAVEKVIFIDKAATLFELADAMKNNFVGYESLRKKLLAAPKYGNNDDFADKYAVWFTKFLSDEFDKYRTFDGGGIYTAMAANTSNIYAGKKIGATPDGRLAAEPLSDAASPTYGRDKNGVTSALISLSKPDYTRCACGTVVNQKFSPSMFEDGRRGRLLSLIKVYFSRGGQEIQINSTSTEVLRDAMEHPERYGSLVVRVSGFSAMYVALDRDVQEDILRRTQQE